MLVRRSRTRRLIVVFAIALAGAAATAQPSVAGEVNTGYFGNVAIKGYDPVAYFTDGAAVKGSEAFAHDWLGAEWHFANAAHRDMFADDPIAYAPQYGGHCADGIAYGEKTVNIDPEAWQIIEGKLYLNFAQTAADEFAQVPEIRRDAEANWPAIRAVLTTR